MVSGFPCAARAVWDGSKLERVARSVLATTVGISYLYLTEDMVLPYDEGKGPVSEGRGG